MAIASRVRTSARTWTFVATGPTTRVSRSIEDAASGLELGLHALEGLADHLVGGPFDHPRRNARERPGQIDIRRPVHDGPAVLPVREVHLRRRVDSAAGRLTVSLDQRAVGSIGFGELHVDVEPGADE